MIKNHVTWSLMVVRLGNDNKSHMQFKTKLRLGTWESRFHHPNLCVKGHRSTVTMLEGLPCKIIYICFVMSTFVCWALVLFLVSFFSISILERLREAGVVAMRLHHAGLLAVHLREVAYIRLAWSEEKMFEMSSMLLCFFVVLSACLLIISRGKCHPESVPVPGKSWQNSNIFPIARNAKKLHIHLSRVKLSSCRLPDNMISICTLLEMLGKKSFPGCEKAHLLYF